MSPRFWRNLPVILIMAGALWVLFYFFARILQFILTTAIGAIS